MFYMKKIQITKFRDTCVYLDDLLFVMGAVSLQGDRGYRGPPGPPGPPAQGVEGQTTVHVPGPPVFTQSFNN